MREKIAERSLAIQLRLEGKSYAEIKRQVPVAKSTLSLWLGSVGLTQHQKQRLTAKRLAAARRGADARKQDRLQRTSEIFSQAALEIPKISRQELWLMGIMLYWAEGSKESPYRPGSGVQFTNSDPAMLKLFLLWLQRCCHVRLERVRFEIYIHESHRTRAVAVRNFWSTKLNIDQQLHVPIYFKKNKIRTLRKNIGADYYGLVRIRVLASSELQRKITGWVRGICKYYWGVV